MKRAQSKQANHLPFIIETRDLTKRYKNFVAVGGVSMHVRRGSVYGFLGPNGAGKSTTMKMLLGLTAPTAGEFEIDGMRFPGDKTAILKEIGSFVESPSYYANLTGRENLDVIRRILGLPESSIDEALELVGLAEFGGRLAKKYSLGMKQRLGLAGALLGRPPILILDEPTNGLDPVGIHEIRNLIKSLPTTYDCTILVSSHMLSEIELMAGDIGILNHGKMLYEGSLDNLRSKALSSGYAAENLEELFLAIIEQDNLVRKQGALLRARYQSSCSRSAGRGPFPCCRPSASWGACMHSPISSCAGRCCSACHSTLWTSCSHSSME